MAESHQPNPHHHNTGAWGTPGRATSLRDNSPLEVPANPAQKSTGLGSLEMIMLERAQHSERAKEVRFRTRQQAYLNELAHNTHVRIEPHVFKRATKSIGDFRAAVTAEAKRVANTLLTADASVRAQFNARERARRANNDPTRHVGGAGKQLGSGGHNHRAGTDSQ